MVKYRVVKIRMIIMILMGGIINLDSLSELVVNHYLYKFYYLFHLVILNNEYFNRY